MEKSPIRLTPEGIGTPKYFGEVFGLTRNLYQGDPEAWAATLHIGANDLSELEQGLRPNPDREELLGWGQVLNIEENDLNMLLIAAGHMPEVPALTDGEFSKVLEGAMREFQQQKIGFWERRRLIRQIKKL